MFLNKLFNAPNFVLVSSNMFHGVSTRPSLSFTCNNNFFFFLTSPSMFLGAIIIPCHPSQWLSHISMSFLVSCINPKKFNIFWHAFWPYHPCWCHCHPSSSSLSPLLSLDIFIIQKIFFSFLLSIGCFLAPMSSFLTPCH
jgi:hypothetical protein